MDLAWWVWALAASLVAVATVVVFNGIRVASRLQRRLFVLFLLLSWLPALALLLFQTLGQRRTESVLESPGLSRALESSLALARDTLAAAESEADAEARRWADQATPGSPDGPDERTWVMWENDEVRVQGGAVGRELLALPATGRRIRTATGDWVVGRTERGTRRWALARPLAPEVGQALEDVQRGSASIRQLRLFYARALRLDVVISSLVLTAVVLLISLWLSRRLARQIGSPIRELSEGTAEVAAGKLDHRVEVRAVDELGDLVRSFNAMTDQLREGRETLRRTERIAAWQGVARRLAHEIKNPLTPIHLSIHRMRGKTDDPTVLECLDTMQEETENLRRLADEFSLYARLPQPRPTSLVVRPLLEQVVDLYLRQSSIRADWTDWQSDDPVRADEGQMRQLLGNLVKNAREAMGESGVLRLTSDRGDGRFRLAVIDDGPGLPLAVDRIFEADFTTKASGTGLGLAICRKIVDDHGGSIAARSGEDGGAIVEVELPLMTRGTGP